MNIHQVNASDALCSVLSSPQGLATTLARTRLKEYGQNRIEPIPREHWLLRFLKEFTSLFSSILWLAAGLAFLADWFDPSQDMARVGVAVMAVIILSGLFSFWQETRVERTLAALQNMLPRLVTVLRDGVAHMLPAEQLVPGDVILLHQGDNVPADCRLIEAFGVRVNRAMVTGESHPQSCDAAPSTAERYLDSRNIVLAGTSLVAGRAKAVVFATGIHTEFGKIANLTQFGNEADSPLRQEVAHLSRVIGFLALAMGAVFFAISGMTGVTFWRDAILSLGIIIALVPEGLLPTLTLSLVLAAQRMARRKVLIRHLPSVETLGSVTVICTDKTGTLTENRMRAQRVFLDLRPIDVDTLASDLEMIRRHDLFLKVACYCQDLTETTHDDQRTFHGDPLEVALVEMSKRLGTRPASRVRCDEWPFDSNRMRQSVIYPEDARQMLYCKGALETVLPLCVSVVDSGKTRELDDLTRATILSAQEDMAAQGLRVIALAARLLPAGCPRDAQEQALTFCGLVGINDPPRADVDVAIAACHAAGIRVIMVTGDHPRTALAIARQIGLTRSQDVKVVVGSQLRHFSAAQLQLALDSPDIIFARVAADQKLRIVEALKAKGHIVAVTGDGVNDAPALRAAHIGIGMGLSGTDVAKEAADMVLMDDNFVSIVAAIEEGRALFQNIRKFLTYVFVHNVAELMPSLAFALFAVPLPLTPVQVLAVDMGTDSLTALALGAERAHSQAMRRPPRSRQEHLMNAALGLRAYLFLGLIEAAAALAAFFHVLHGGGWQYGTDLPSADPLYRQATTACLAAIVLLQIANVFLCRSAIRSIFTTGLGGNPLMLWGIGLQVVLIMFIVYTPWGHALFATATLPLEVWLFLLPWVIGMVALEELRKWLARRQITP